MCSANEVSFDERIALELDALDQLGTVESPVAERQMIIFQNIQQVYDGDEGAQVDTVAKQPAHEDVDCDEVRIMIKVLGSKVW